MYNFKSLLISLIAFILAEIIAALIFILIRKKYASKLNASSKNKSITKGLLERFVLFCGLTANFQSILIVFGTLKIATRIKDDQNEKVSNDYFIVGNFMSILMVFVALFLTSLGIKFL